MADAQTPHIVRSIGALRAALSEQRAAGARIGLAPTMGALHEGHLSLVRRVKQQCGFVTASIFVNPRQFGANEDLARYPRDEAGDVAKLASAGCDLVYAPTPEEMYPPDFSTAITVSGVSDMLEGAQRPHFFGGVATVVAKLLIQALPDAAIFGQKDYQQLLVIRRLVRDLDLPIEILAGETVREPDGLALSSRNAYLSHNERAVAGRLNEVLKQAAAAVRAGGAIGAAQAHAVSQLREAGFDPVDYVSIRRAGDLSEIVADEPAGPARILAAAWLGETRLIDNLPV